MVILESILSEFCVRVSSSNFEMRTEQCLDYWFGSQGIFPPLTWQVLGWVLVERFLFGGCDIVWWRQIRACGGDLIKCVMLHGDDMQSRMVAILQVGIVQVDLGCSVSFLRRLSTRVTGMTVMTLPLAESVNGINLLLLLLLFGMY